MHKERLLLVSPLSLHSRICQTHREVEDWLQMQERHGGAFQIDGRFDQDGHSLIYQPMLIQTMLKYSMAASSN